MGVTRFRWILFFKYCDAGFSMIKYQTGIANFGKAPPDLASSEDDYFSGNDTKLNLYEITLQFIPY